MPTISIIVPVYKVENYIEHCIKSILSQTFSDFELILVDDGSPDKSGLICDEWSQKDSRIKVIHQENAGQCAARNAGIDVARGEYLMFIDSDDYVNVDICKKLYEVISKSNADTARCSYRIVNNHSDYTAEENTAAFSVYTAEEALTNFVTEPYSSHKPFTAVVCAALYKKSLFDDIRFPNGFIYEEGFVLPKIFIKCNKLAFTDTSLYYYYVNNEGTMSGGLTQRGLKSIDDWKEIHLLLFDKFPALRIATAERWINKYIKIYGELIKRSDIDTDGYYKNMICAQLKEREEYFKDIVGKETYKKICAFNKGYEAYKKFIRTNEIKNIIKAKLRF